MQNTPAIEEGLPGITFELIQEKDTSARFDLACFVRESEQSGRASIVYRTALFEERTIATFLSRFEALLESIVVEPDTAIDELNISTAQEKIEKESNVKKLYSSGSKSWRNRKGNAVDVSTLVEESMQQEK
jgi:non-ribosomal peptide synthetase component F